MTIELCLIIGFLLHLVGDYLTQNDWIAQNKTKLFIPAFIHATIYSLPFLFICWSYWWFLIYMSHFLIDRYRLATYWIRLINLQRVKTFVILFNSAEFKKGEIIKSNDTDLLILEHYNNILQTRNEYRVTEYKENIKVFNTIFGYFKYYNTPTGYSNEKSLWMSVWLMIIIDNSFHLLINSISIYLANK